VPRSRIRSKAPFTPPATKSKAKLPSPRWVAPLMVGLFLFGLLWVVVFYVSRGAYPIESLNNLNLLVGFAFIAAGFVVSTQWR
jgi:hypothetical protein